MCNVTNGSTLRAVFLFKTAIASEDYMIKFKVHRVKNSANTTVSEEFSGFKAFDE
jgi:hypothetical protein